MPSTEDLVAKSIFSRADIEQAARDQYFHSALQDEVEAAREKHPPLASVHYFYGVLLEEVAELFDEIRKQQKDHDPQQMLRELIQIACVAQRCATEHLIPNLLNVPRGTPKP